MPKEATKRPFDVRRAWREVEKELQAMTDSERVQTLVDAGILTRSGAVARPYKGVFKLRAK